MVIVYLAKRGLLLPHKKDHVKKTPRDKTGHTHFYHTFRNNRSDTSKRSLNRLPKLHYQEESSVSTALVSASRGGADGRLILPDHVPDRDVVVIP